MTVVLLGNITKTVECSMCIDIASNKYKVMHGTGYCNIHTLISQELWLPTHRNDYHLVMPAGTAHKSVSIDGNFLISTRSCELLMKTAYFLG